MCFLFHFFYKILWICFWKHKNLLKMPSFIYLFENWDNFWNSMKICSKFVTNFKFWSIFKMQTIFDAFQHFWKTHTFFKSWTVLEICNNIFKKIQKNKFDFLKEKKPVKRKKTEREKNKPKSSRTFPKPRKTDNEPLRCSQNRNLCYTG